MRKPARKGVNVGKRFSSTRQQAKPQPQQSPSPFVVRYYQGGVLVRKCNTQQEAEAFYDSLPLHPNDKALIKTAGNEVLR